jgi:hypothetical protein
MVSTVFFISVFVWLSGATLAVWSAKRLACDEERG